MNWLTAFDAFLANPGIESNMNPPASLKSIQGFEADLAQQQRV